MVAAKKSPKEGKTAKATKATKPAKGGREKSVAFQDPIQEDDATKTVVVIEEIQKTEKEFASGDAKNDEPISETGKSGKAGKGGKGTKGKPTKSEKPEKAVSKGGKVEKGGKVMKTGSAGKTQKKISIVDVDEVEPPPAEPDLISKPVPEEESMKPIVTEKNVDAPDLSTAELSEKGDFLIPEEISEEQQKEFADFGDLIEEFGELEEEEEATKRDSIDDRYPIESNESDDEDQFKHAVRYQDDRKVKVVQYDFWEHIGHIPDVDEISIDASIQRYINKIEGPATVETEDVIVEEVEEEGEEEQEAFGGESQIPIEDIFSSEISLEYDFESSEEEEEAKTEAAAKKVSDTNLFEALLKLEKPDIVVEKIDFELLERLEQERLVKEQTSSFLKELIDCVVEAAEYEDPLVIIRQSVDKKKLFNRLHDLLVDFTEAGKINKFLDRKVVDYYRRQKSFRAITPHPDDIVEEEKSKYLVVVDELNSLLGKEKTMREIISNKINDVEVEEAKVKEELGVLLDKLHALIRKTFAKRNNDRLNMMVDKRIKEMCDVRKELSGVREVLINRQHIMARLKEKMVALENIGPGLFLRDFEDLQHERYVLIKKIEERHDDLDKYRLRFHAYTNILAHFRESETMLFQTMEFQHDILDEVRLERKKLRAFIYELKKSRVKVQKKIREMSFQCGLIDKPALCIDYDETLERCIVKREINKNLKNDIALVEKKIDFYTKCLELKERR